MEKWNSRPNKNESPAEDLLEMLSRNLGAEVSIESVGTTYEIDAEDISLSFTLDDDIEIRNIDTRGNTGSGSRVLNLIHSFADEHGLAVTASNVRDDATGFWEKMGYQEGSIDGEYFRA